MLISPRGSIVSMVALSDISLSTTTLSSTTLFTIGLSTIELSTITLFHHPTFDHTCGTASQTSRDSKGILLSKWLDYSIYRPRCSKTSYTTS
jgi:hypothetical protein